MTGISTLIAFAYVVGPWALANLIALAILAFRRSYRRRTVAFVHSGLAALGPAYGLFVVLRDFSDGYHVTDRNVALIVLAAIFLLACFPLVAYRLQRTPNSSSKPTPLRGAA